MIFSIRFVANIIFISRRERSMLCLFTYLSVTQSFESSGGKHSIQILYFSRVGTKLGEGEVSVIRVGVDFIDLDTLLWNLVALKRAV